MPSVLHDFPFPPLVHLRSPGSRRNSLGGLASFLPAGGWSDSSFLWYSLYSAGLNLYLGGGFNPSEKY